MFNYHLLVNCFKFSLLIRNDNISDNNCQFWQRHSVLRDYSGFVRFSYEDPVRLGNRTYRDWVKSDQSMEN